MVPLGSSTQCQGGGGYAYHLCPGLQELAVLVLDGSEMVEGGPFMPFGSDLHEMALFALQMQREGAFRGVLGLICVKQLRLAHGHQ